MSQPNEPWEEHWRDTLADHETSPPSAHDWSGMEQLLEAKVVPASPIKAPIPGPAGWRLKLPSLPWPVWVIAIASVLALGYWLGSHTALSVSQEMDAVRKKTSLTEAVAPPIDTVFDTLYVTGVHGEITDEIASIDWAIVNRTNSSSSQKSPEINTSNPAGEGASTPPTSLAISTRPPEDNDPTQLGGSVTKIPRPATIPFTPGFTYSDPANRKLNRTRPVRRLKTLSPPSDQELWERRVNELVQSGKLVITPTRLGNGYFPAYRLRQ